MDYRLLSTVISVGDRLGDITLP